jgi:hypothetical protein
MIQSGSSPTINNGGTGYTVGNVLTIVGGTPTGSAATMTVTSVSGGVITGVNYTNFASYSVVPTSPFSVTGGTGSGATFTSGWYPSAFTITNAGSGYVEQPTVTFSGGGGSGAAAYATVGNISTIRALGNIFPGNISDSLQFRTPSGIAFSLSDRAATTSNYLTVLGNGTGGSAILRSSGSDANVNASIGTQGTGFIQFHTNTTTANEQMRITHTASAVNYVQATGNVTGSGPVISAQGSDTNVVLRVASKGTGSLAFATNYAGSGTGNTQVVVSHTANSVNFLNLTGAATGVAPVMSAAGSDTNIDLSLITKGTGSIRMSNGNGLQFRVNDTFGSVASSNWWEVSGRGATAAPLFGVAGETNTSGIFYIKGSGFHRFATGAASDNGGGSVDQFRVAHTASAVNYVQVTGAATGSGPLISAQGSDANAELRFQSKGTGSVNVLEGGGFNSLRVLQRAASGDTWIDIQRNVGFVDFIAASGVTDGDIRLTPKGAGNVRFGTYTGTALSIAGYIEIKDAGGTIRRLAVVA